MYAKDRNEIGETRQEKIVIGSHKTLEVTIQQSLD